MTLKLPSKMETKLKWKLIQLQEKILQCKIRSFLEAAVRKEASSSSSCCVWYKRDGEKFVRLRWFDLKSQVTSMTLEWYAQDQHWQKGKLRGISEMMWLTIPAPPARFYFEIVAACFVWASWHILVV